LEPADLGDCFNAVRIIRVSGEKPVLDTLLIVQRMSAAVSVSSGAPEDESETGFATVLWTGSGTDEERISLHCGQYMSSPLHRRSRTQWVTSHD
jgi:hypothetical protein